MTDVLPPQNFRLYRTEQIRQLEHLAITELHLSGYELMQRAGIASWHWLQQSWPGLHKLVVVCGGGNNAGDGYAIATIARKSGKQVIVLALRPMEPLQAEALQAARNFQQQGGKVKPFDADELQQADVIVDAILGIGLEREVSGDLQECIQAINQSGKPVFAVDVPSGLNANTGRVMGAAIRANITLSFIGRKQGLYTGSSADYCGVHQCENLDLPHSIIDRVVPSAYLLDRQTTVSDLPKRQRRAHKGHFGHLLVIGGDYGYAGAVRMCAEMAARSGVGLVSIATRAEHAQMIPLARPELMAAGVASAANLVPLLHSASVLAIGPGLGHSDWSTALLAKVLDTQIPMVVDADGLNLLAQDPARRDNWVLTPHPGEAARLLGISVAEVEADRFAAARLIQHRYGGVIVLKGSGTIVVDSACQVSVCSGGNPGMASGGMGDVLTGLIAGLMCQQLSTGNAARLAVCIHAEAADIVATQTGERGLLATDLIPIVRQLLNS